jgi:predicted TIM-barrel fold metal-dependent hydrolase
VIIDIHAHVYADPRIKPRPGGTTFMSAEQQLQVMDAKGVDMAVILPLNCAECPAEMQSIGEVLSICEKYPGRFIPFCNVDPRIARDPGQITVEDFEYLLGQYKDLGCKGVGEVTARIPWDSHPLMCMFEACERLGLVVTFHTITADVNSYGIIDEVGLPRFEKVVRRFPKLNFFGHSPGFWSEISGDMTAEDKNGYPKRPVTSGGVVSRLFRETANVFGDLSAGSGLNALTRDPDHAYGFIEEFQDRLLLGLDYCSITNDPEHIEWLTAARDGGHISGQAYDKIMWQNADRILDLGLHSS